MRTNQHKHLCGPLLPGRPSDTLLTPSAPPVPPCAVVAIKGNFMLGLNFLFISLYPMRVGATMMSSFLVNVAIILTMSAAVIQFCSQAFAVYANNTAIADIFGNQVCALACAALP
jgi:hypothetical protein